jgi:aldehyde:ferredoxin oxidoreductase
VVLGNKKVQVADPDKLAEVNKRARFLRKGLNESVYMTEPMIQGIDHVKPSPCYACPAGCMRATFRHTSGREEVRKSCASAYYYVPWDQMYSEGATEVPFLATSLCDRFGLCTHEMANVIHWLYNCFQKGILSEDKTGLPLSKIGSLEFIEALVDMITYKRGFGEVLAEGTRRASIEEGKEAEEVGLARVMPSGYANDSYGARLFLTTSLFYATEPHTPIIQLHEVNFMLLKWALCYTTSGAMSPITTEDLRRIAKQAWGTEKSVDFSTYDAKAEAAFIIQNRQHAKESMVACDRYFPILDTDQKEDRLGDPALVPQLFEAVTGNSMSLDDYLQLGELSVNLQRAIMGREGRAGRQQDALNEFNFTEGIEKSEGVFGMFNPDMEMPGAGDEIVVRKGKTVDRAEFERMKDEYYELRKWDPETGLQKRDKLHELGLEFLCKEMDTLKLLSP